MACTAGEQNGEGQCDIPQLSEGETYSQVSAGLNHAVLLWSDDKPCNIYIRVACLNSFRKDHRYRGGIVFNEGGLQDAFLAAQSPLAISTGHQRVQEGLGSHGQPKSP